MGTFEGGTATQLAVTVYVFSKQDQDIVTYDELIRNLVNKMNDIPMGAFGISAPIAKISKTSLEQIMASSRNLKFRLHQKLT
ncbi:MAG: hypothetical protein LUQ47_05055 [Methanotrichaceae archaeon]|nr:hypothetical protein [Methanotrichaceae archaeon]